MPVSGTFGIAKYRRSHSSAWLRNSLWFPKRPKVGEQHLLRAEPRAAPGKERPECAVKAPGADHILFETSCPVRPVWLQEGASFVRNLDITESVKELILRGNAERLYNSN